MKKLNVGWGSKARRGPAITETAAIPIFVQEEHQNKALSAPPIPSILILLFLHSNQTQYLPLSQYQPLLPVPAISFFPFFSNQTLSHSNYISARFHYLSPTPFPYVHTSWPGAARRKADQPRNWWKAVGLLKYALSDGQESLRSMRWWG